MKTLLAAALTLASGHAFALTDFTCLNQCTNSGSVYQFCHQKCTVPDQSAMGTPQPLADDPMRTQRMKQIDFKCMNDCTQGGYQYGFCKAKCEY